MRGWLGWLVVLIVVSQLVGVHGFLQFLNPRKPPPQIVGHYSVHFGVPKTSVGAQRHRAPRFQRFIRDDQEARTKTSTAFVSVTESGTYGALNPKDGAMVWRRYDKSRVQALYSMGDAIVTLSGRGGAIVRVVVGKTGELIWESRLHEDPEANASLTEEQPGVHATGTVNDMVIVSNAKDVRRFKVGQELWYFSPQEDVFVTSSIVTASHVYVLSTTNQSRRSRLRIYVLSKDGQLEATHDIDTDLAHGAQGLLSLPWTKRPHFPPGLQVQSGGPHVVFLGTDGAVHAVRLDDASPRKSMQRVRARSGRSFVQLLDVGIGDRGFFLATRDDFTAEVLRVDENGRLHSMWEFEEDAEDAIYEGSFDRNGHAYIMRVYFTRSQQLLNQHVFWADAYTGTERGQVTGMSFQYDHDLHGNVVAAPFEVSKVSPYQLAVRAAYVTSSGAIHLIQDGTHHWVLEEGLAEQPHTLLVSPPDKNLGLASIALKDVVNAETAPLVALEHESFLHRTVRHISMLSKLPQKAMRWAITERGGFDWMMRLLLDHEKDSASLRQPTAGGARLNQPDTPIVAPRLVPDEDFASLFHDAFGTRQIIIAATHRGKVYGIQTDLDGSRLLWQRSLIGFGLGEGNPEPSINITDLVLMRSAGTLIEEKAVPPLIAIVAQITEPGQAMETRLFELNPLTGEVARNTEDGALLCNGPVRQLVNVPLNAADSRTLGAVCGNSGYLVLYPPTHTMLPSLEERLPHMFLGIAGEHGVQGHELRRSTSVLLQAVPTWYWPLQHGEEIVSMYDRSMDNIASEGRVVGDRSVLYKYLNPHGRLLTTYIASEKVANVYLLDMVTGSLEFHMRIPHVEKEQGIHTTFVENWITVQYATNQTAEGSEPQPLPDQNAPPWYSDSLAGFTRRLVSVELYHPETSLRPNVSSLAYGGKGTGGTYAAPIAFVRSFLLPYGVLSTGITRTTLGVTNKGLLLATDRENIVMIPRSVLDARRPVGKPSSADMQEGLLPYTPEIPDEPAWHLTRTAYRLMEIKSLQASASLLESSSMVLGVGLDWMYTMGSPSGQFDRLQASFNKLQLVLTITGLLLSILVSNPIVRGRRIASRW
ncbi:hypothetical protein MPSI1_003366 [Malassezia psittaci]|uniref:ER membrane protein complex subunit 1 n=1 Tax=Malassezia psittaci TaxID=1821823 RepID=A0AAF0FEM9_9BASI|nr:hypothetical protein MPSI1_003366 [Malassezia psittaci]